MAARQRRRDPACRRGGGRTRAPADPRRHRERVEQHRFHDAEDGGVRANAERQRHDGDSRKPGRSPELAQRVANVLEQRVDDGADAHVANLVLQECLAPQLEPGVRDGPRPGDMPARTCLVDQQLECGTQLFVEIAIDAGRRCTRLRHRLSERRDGQSHASSARAMASAMWFHSVVSSPSCRRPALRERVVLRPPVVLGRLPVRC